MSGSNTNEGQDTSPLILNVLSLGSIVSFSALTLLVGRQEGHPTCKKLGAGLLVMTN